MEDSEEDVKVISTALIKASNATETEWLKIEKVILESLPTALNENSSLTVQRMWNELYRKIADSIERMKKLE